MLKSILLFPAVIATSAATAIHPSVWDIADNTFSPNGELRQLALAGVAATIRSPVLCIGVECKDGALVSTRTSIPRLAAPLFKTARETAFRNAKRVGKGICMVCSGMQGDRRALVRDACGLARKHREEWGEPARVRWLAEALGAHIHAWSLRGDKRAIGCWSILAGSGGGIWIVEHTGLVREPINRTAACVGQGASELQKAIRDIRWCNTTCQDALRIIMEYAADVTPGCNDTFHYKWEAAVLRQEPEPSLEWINPLDVETKEKSGETK